MGNPNSQKDNDFEFIRDAFLKDCENIEFPSSLSGANLIVKYSTAISDMSGEKSSNKVISFKKKFWGLTACAACLILSFAILLNSGIINADTSKPIAQKSMPKMAEAPQNSEFDNGVGLGAVAYSDEIQECAPEAEAEAEAEAQNILFDEETIIANIISPAQIISNSELVCNSVYLTKENETDGFSEIFSQNEEVLTSIMAVVRAATPCDTFSSESETPISCNLNFENGETQLLFFAEPEHFEWLGENQNLSYIIEDGTYEILSGLILAK